MLSILYFVKSQHYKFDIHKVFFFHELTQHDFLTSFFLKSCDCKNCIGSTQFLQSSTGRRAILPAHGRRKSQRLSYTYFASQEKQSPGRSVRACGGAAEQRGGGGSLSVSFWMESPTHAALVALQRRAVRAVYRIDDRDEDDDQQQEGGIDFKPAPHAAGESNARSSAWLRTVPQPLPAHSRE